MIWKIIDIIVGISLFLIGIYGCSDYGENIPFWIVVAVLIASVTYLFIKSGYYIPEDEED